MKLIIIILINVLGCQCLIAQLDMGYMSGCVEYNSDILYKKLIPIIDSNTINDLIYKEDTCIFKVTIELNKKTAHPINVLIRDKCCILTEKQKEEFESILMNTEFVFCHEEEAAVNMPALDVYKDSKILFHSSSFAYWWDIIKPKIETK